MKRARSAVASRLEKVGRAAAARKEGKLFKAGGNQITARRTYKLNSSMTRLNKRIEQARSATSKKALSKVAIGKGRKSVGKASRGKGGGGRSDNK